MNLGLSALALPPILPGEVLPEPSPSVPLGDTLFYDENGAPLPGSLVECGAYILATQQAPGGSLRSKPFHRGGERLMVRTDYLGVNMSMALGGPYPLVWETRVFSISHHWVFDTWRYATRAAAHAGHATVVAVLREQQRARWRRMAGI